MSTTCPCVGCDDSPEPIEGEGCDDWPCNAYIDWGEIRKTEICKEDGHIWSDTMPQVCERCGVAKGDVM